jgi:hypothetical protein
MVSKHIWACLSALLSSGIGCTSVPLESAHQVARSEFSREHYCPIARVSAATTASSVVAPPAIARDPERLAIWTQRKRQTAREPIGQDGASPRMVLASGCGENVEYACYIEGGWETHRASPVSRYVDATTVCVER